MAKREKVVDFNFLRPGLLATYAPELTLMSTGTPTTEEMGSTGYVMDLAATGEAEVIAAHANDVTTIDPARRPIMIVRMQVSTALTSGSFWEIGMVANHNSAVNSGWTDGAWFRSAAADNSLLLESDRSSAALRLDDQDTLIELSGATLYDLKIDITDTTDVQFAYRAASATPGAWTALLPAVTFAVHATNKLQPMMHMSKANGSTVGGITIESFVVTQDVV